jgi:hypothetical protein
MKYNSENKYIVDLNILNTYNAKGCEACNQKFNLGGYRGPGLRTLAGWLCQIHP